MDQLTAADDIIHNQVSEYFALRSVFGIKAGTIHVHDKDVDARKMREGIFIVPEVSETNLIFSHATVRLLRRWTIQFEHRGKSTKHIRQIEQGLIEALSLLVDRFGPDETALVIPPPGLDPYRLGPISLVSGSDPDREPILDEPERWSDELQIQMVLEAQRSDLRTAMD